MLVNNRIQKIMSIIILMTLIVAYSAPLEMEEIPDQLEKISTFEFGQSREVLSEFESFVHTLIDSPIKKAELENQLIDFLKSDATWTSKQFICKQISLIGSKKSVPVLIELLNNESTANMALYGLERIQDPSVDKALRKMLKKTDGNIQIGIINTMGIRQDVKASKQLKSYLNASNTNTAKAAASALAKIGDERSTKYLYRAIQKTKPEYKDYLLDNYLACGDQLLKKGKTTKAIEIYQFIYDRNHSASLRGAALRGLILTQPQKGLSCILESTQKDDAKVQAVGFSLIPDLPENISFQKLYDQMDSFSESGKVQILAALAERNETTAHDVVLKALKDDNELVQIQAIKSLQTLGKSDDVLLLAELAANKKGDVSSVAQDVLYIINDKSVNAEILRLIPITDSKVKIELIRSTRERYITDATPVLIQTLKDPSSRVKREAYKSLGIIAQPESLNELLAGIKEIQTNSVRTEAEKALALVTLKNKKGPERTNDVLIALKETKDISTKGSLLAILGKIGEDEGLPVLKKALKNKNVELRIAGVKALSEWPNAEPVNDLKAQVKKSKNNRLQKLAFRGWIQLIDKDEILEDSYKVTQYTEALNLAADDQDKKLVLSALSNVKTKNAFDIVIPLLKNQALQSEAEMALVGIGMDLRGKYPDEIKSIFSDIKNTTQNENLKRRLNYFLTSM